MTDKKQLPEIDTGDDDIQSMEQLEKAAQLSAIKAQADLLQVPYAANIGLETLSERVRAFKVSQKLEKFDTPEDTVVDGGELLSTTTGIKVPADVEAQYAIFHAKQLVRVSIVCLNPAKSELESDLYTIFSSSLGRVSQVIPYQAPNGYHIPRCLANFLRDKKYVGFRPTKRKQGENGVDREHFEMAEFLITDMPPLEAHEFDRIAKRQDRLAAVNTEEGY